MPKKKVTVKEEEQVSLSRPQRNMKAKVVFDPSDVHVPKKRKNIPKKSGQCVNTSKKKIQCDKKNNQNIKPKSKLIKELPDASINEVISVFSKHSLSNSPIRNTSETCEEVLNICSICSENILANERKLVDCKICMVKVHEHCLITKEPMWKFKTEQYSWFCKPCKNKFCSKCHKVKSQSNEFYRCITCNIGFHIECYESCDIEPLHNLNPNAYLCIPCLTLATHEVPEDELLAETHSSDSLPVISDEDTNDETSIKSFSSTMTSQNSEQNYSDVPKDNIPNITSWDKYRVHQYLSDRGLPEIVTKKIIDDDLDGCAIQLLQRSDITENMGLKLGPALKFYKEVRILQTQSLNYSVFWD